MPRARIPIGLVSQICVESQPEGVSALYLVDTRKEQDAEDVAKFFNDFASVLQSIQLCNGKLVAYAVRVESRDQAVLDEIEEYLKKNFEFVISHRSFDTMIYDIVRELCKDTSSTILPMPKCDICGKFDPFPQTLVRLLDKDSVHLATRTYCTTCTAEAARRRAKEFVMTLLAADQGGLGAFCEMKLVRSRSSKKRTAFKIKPDAERQFAIR